MTSRVTATRLPEATTARWQPLRIGLVNLFHYDHQEFWFRDGRLLLRGNNGTGKSKVLALTLPFLLDGEMSASRIEPDGDRTKKMEWNLLLDGAHEERLGYAWLELGRVGEDGEATYLCVGCGMKAVAGRGSPDRWFFVSSQRIGRDLFLIGPNDTTLTRERLVEAIGPAGNVTPIAAQHRRNLDERLFHLGAERYSSLIELLLQLRQPQLSKRPSEERLSTALSKALSPLDPAVLADIASAFHDLEQQREELSALSDTRENIEQFLTCYRLYASIAARRQGSVLRKVHSEYEERGRQRAALAAEVESAERERAAREAELERAESELVAQGAARDELRAHADLAWLDSAKKQLVIAEGHATRTREQHEDAERARADRESSRERSRAQVEASRASLSEGQLAAARRADSAGLASEHGALLALVSLPDGATRDEIDALRARVQPVAERRREAIRHVQQLVAVADRARAREANERTTLSRLEGERDAAADRRQQTQVRLAESASELVASWQAYARALVEIELPDVDAWRPELETWTETLDDANPALRMLQRQAALRERGLADDRAAVTAQRQELSEQIRALHAERERLEAGETARPPLPHTRSEGVRDGRPGAPLWQVTDFAEHVESQDRAGIEAALEASGLLDAWVLPDGRLLAADTHDVIVYAGATVQMSVSEVLVPAIDAADPQAAALSEATVSSVLSSIGLGEQSSSAWVASSGDFSVGPLRGAWMKAAAEFVGRGARDDARRRRLEQLARELDDLQALRARADEHWAEIARRQRVLEAEREGAPSDDALRTAHAALASARADLEKRETWVAEQVQVVSRLRTETAGAEAARDEAASDLHLPTDSEALIAVLDAVSTYREVTLEFIASLRLHGERMATLAAADAECERAEAQLVRTRADAREAQEQASVARAALDALERSIGATIERIQSELDRVVARIRELEREVRAGRERTAELRVDLARNRERTSQLDERQTEAAERRESAIRAFQQFAGTGLLELAAPEAEIPPLPPYASDWAAEPAVRLARRIDQMLTHVREDDEAWKRSRDDLNRRFHELAEALTRHGHHAQQELTDWVLVTVHFQGKERAPEELATLLRDEIKHRERLLTARERELLEEHLIGDVATQLQQRISEAEQQVARMNAELEERPTSTGMRLRLRWTPKPDAPAGLSEARRRLLHQQAELWSPEDRDAVGEFLHRQIEEQRAREEPASWQEHLQRALDYRAWHRFQIERYQDRRWRSASGPASGGERVLVVSLPLFAAAAAYYQSAHPHAPRLVLLDEAFAGVDDDSRAKCLGLLAQFDLDVVMTSEREWGFYSTVPGIATHQLVRREGIDAVHVTSWEWDGHARERVDRTYASRAGAEHLRKETADRDGTATEPETTGRLL